jgi:hypothetical protein
VSKTVAGVLTVVHSHHLWFQDILITPEEALPPPSPLTPDDREAVLNLLGLRVSELVRCPPSRKHHAGIHGISFCHPLTNAQWVFPITKSPNRARGPGCSLMLFGLASGLGRQRHWL